MSAVEKPKPSSVQSALYMAFNFFSSVSIITVNKFVFDRYGFKYSTFLTALHFMVTFSGLLVCASIGMFKIKYVGIRQILPLSFAFVGFVVFNNLSLQYNSVGFYQLMKVLTTPVIVVVQLVLYGVALHNRLKVALIPICIGVAMATVSDVSLNLPGVTFALLGIASTSMYQIWVKTKQQDLQLDSYQLLFLQCPTSAVMVIVLSLMFEPWFPTADNSVSILTYDYTVESVMAIMASCALAFLVNLSIFLVIGKTSPVAYNVLGHGKLCVILISGFVLFGEDPQPMKVAGTLLAFAGVIWYTTIQQNLPKTGAKSSWESRDKEAAASAPAINGGSKIEMNGYSKVASKDPELEGITIGDEKRGTN